MSSSFSILNQRRHSEGGTTGGMKHEVTSLICQILRLALNDGEIKGAKKKPLKQIRGFKKFSKYFYSATTSKLTSTDTSLCKPT